MCRLSFHGAVGGVSRGTLANNLVGFARRVSVLRGVVVIFDRGALYHGDLLYSFSRTRKPALFNR